jgi:hypothetical protein
MITLKMYDRLHIFVDCDDREILLKLKDHFSEYAPGYAFSPKFKVGH